MHKLFSLVIIFLGITGLGSGIGGLGVYAWAGNWRGCAVSAVILAIGILFVDSGRYVYFRPAE